MEMDILQLLDAGGNLSSVVIAVLLWKLDKRISHLEWEWAALKNTPPTER